MIRENSHNLFLFGTMIDFAWLILYNNFPFRSDCISATEVTYADIPVYQLNSQFTCVQSSQFVYCYLIITNDLFSNVRKTYVVSFIG